MESNVRSITKSVLWRIIGVAVLMIITYVVTGSWVQSTLITVIHHVSFVFIYYGHERMWLKTPRPSGKKRIIAKMFTYEIVLGHCVLGLISLVITGSWTSVTLITIVYIENKLWMYALYEYLWNRFSWQVKK